jgi:hypothetical protein
LFIGKAVPGCRARTAAKLFDGEKFGSNAVVIVAVRSEE